MDSFTLGIDAMGACGPQARGRRNLGVMMLQRTPRNRSMAGWRWTRKVPCWQKWGWKRSVYALGGDRGARTPDLLHAMQALSQLSYIPT